MKARVLAAAGTTILMVSPAALGVVIDYNAGSVVHVRTIVAMAQRVAPISEAGAILLFGTTLLACAGLLQRVVFRRT